jgi:cell division protein ZapE
MSPGPQPAEAGPVSARYRALAANGEITNDPAQAALAARLDGLDARLAERRLAAKKSALGWLFAARPSEPVKGLYIHGAVGRGKTLMMDAFFAVAAPRRKRRAHFHEFMADVHERVRRFREKAKSGELANGDPIRRTADEIADETTLLCFDEFHVTDIADAMILGRLFERLFERGVVLVATSNVAPADLYLGGLNRALFLPFIRMIEERVDVVRLDARTDFRLEKLDGVAVWYVPADASARHAIDLTWRRIAGAEGGEPVELPLKGRTIHVPQAGGGAARFAYADLCMKSLGALDFLRISRAFHTVVIDEIPLLTERHRNEVRRFILLIDTLYDRAVKLVASAAAEPDRLFPGSDTREAFEFRRTASRLYEMRSMEYLSRPHGAGDSSASGDTTGLVET